MEHFGTMARSMYTLVQIMTLDMWSSKIVRHVLNNQSYMALFFCGLLASCHTRCDECSGSHDGSAHGFAE